MTRRQLLATPALAAQFRAAQSGGVTLNEDPNHFFVARRARRLTHEIIRQWVDQYADTQVSELVLNVNAMRSSFASKQREAWWTGFDPKGGKDQPFLSPVAPASRQVFHDWIRCGWQMNEDKLDLYSIWIPEIRRRKISPWLSIRMNDLHNVDQEDHPMHSSFWRENKQFRRVPYRDEQRDKALDYAHPEVRDYYLRYIEECCERYDFDTLELDWMRHGFHFRPGYEDAGARILTQYHSEIRKLLNQWQRRRKHPIGLAVRVPGSPLAARHLGMDAAAWAHNNDVNYVTATNYWRTVDTNMPIEEWRALLPKQCTLAAGLELGCNAFLGSVAGDGRAWQSNSLESVRGVAAAYLHRGVDRIYLFNYMDADTTLDDVANYPALLREVGQQQTIAGKPRRHIVTYQDTWGPGDPVAHALPVDLKPNQWRAFRLPTGPTDSKLQASVLLGLSNSNVRVRVNGENTAPGTPIATPKPGPATPVFRFATTAPLRAGENLIEVTAQQDTRIEWVELNLASWQ
ncbi:hypothetical protein [Bryobacter aggregatus]|uniref:hypothetical protein n=1 Tax=Bryobacter aggregatus TaxID=360054 RepID=UPI0004E12FA8|nr:hypothetical protein [Bryobacter aggregatus]